MGALVVRESWLSRLLVKVRLLAPGDHKAGTDFGTGVAREAGYSSAQAMSAFAAFPWVKACVTAKSVDLSGLPLRLTRGKGSAAEVIDDHEIHELLAQPSERVNGLSFRRQLWVDLDLTGNWFGALIGPSVRPVSLLRLHPARVRVLSTSDGQVEGYEYDRRGGSSRYAWDSVLHVRGPSWEDDPQGLFGTGLIRSLHNDLTSDLAAQKTSAKAARKGRPDAVVRPKGDVDRWTPDQVNLIKHSIESRLAEAEGGALVLGGSAEYTPMSWSPKDMAFPELRKHVREAVLAAAGVPPSRVSLPTANYAQSREMDRTYWQALQGEASMIDAELTRMARLWDPRFRISHDFSAVPALQEDRSLRVDRVHKWWMMGIGLSEAAAYEGFEDLPEPESLSRPSSQAPSGESVQAHVQTFRAWWRRAPSPPTLQPVEVVPYLQTEEGRAGRWRGFIDRVHTPVERGLNLTMRRFLKEQAARYAERLAEVLPQSSGVRVRALSDADLARLLSEAEEALAMGEAIGGQLLDALSRAFAAAMEDLDLSGLTDTAIQTEEALLKEDMMVRIGNVTSEAVTIIVRDGIATGATIQEMQASITASRGFDPVRALRIARTETTRAVNRGTVLSYRQAVQELPDLKMEWLTSRDDAVRDTHFDMDGEKSEVDGSFVNPVTGAKAQHPGAFGIPSEDINCRCTVLPAFGA